MYFTRLGTLAFAALLFFSFSQVCLYAQANFVYTNDDLEDVFGENTVSGFSVAANGVLTPIPGSPFQTGGVGSGGGLFAANRVTTCIVGNFLYASNDVSADVSGFFAVAHPALPHLRRASGSLVAVTTAAITPARRLTKRDTHR